MMEYNHVEPGQKLNVYGGTKKKHGLKGAAKKLAGVPIVLWMISTDKSRQPAQMWWGATQNGIAEMICDLGLKNGKLR